jgi:hypothetical protein
MKVNCKNEGQLQSFKREQFAVRGTNVLCSSRAVHASRFDSVPRTHFRV